jgi:5'-nucleotidase
MWTRQAVVPATDPMGREVFWFTVTKLEGADEGTDLWAMEQGYVSMTPLRLDLTNHAALERALAEYPAQPSQPVPSR